MATSVTFNSTSFSVPETGEEDWGGTSKVDGLLVSLAGNALSKAGGTFTLTTEVDFGGTAGLKALSYKSQSSNPATAGILRLGTAESIGWRNNANSGNLLLTTNASDNLVYDGSVIATATPGAADTVNTSNGTDIVYQKIVNANVDAAAAIDRSKVASGTNYRILANSAAGVMSENAALTAAHVVIADANGQLAGEAALAVSRGGTNLSSYTTGDLPYASGATAISKLGIGSTGDLLTVSAGIPAWAPPPSSTIPTGTMTDYVGSSAPSGWILASGLTMGNAASAGTGRANADTETLFTLLWDSFGNSELAVSGGRGANAAADFAANKNIALPDLRGRVIAGKDNMGGTTASRITNTESGIVGTTLGAAGGVQSVTLTSAQSGVPAHTHGGAGGDFVINKAGNTFTAGAGAFAFATDISAANSTASAASSHSSTQPTYILNKIIKL